jgi:hypothetical protein
MVYFLLIFIQTRHSKQLGESDGNIEGKREVTIDLVKI